MAMNCEFFFVVCVFSELLLIHPHVWEIARKLINSHLGFFLKIFNSTLGRKSPLWYEILENLLLTRKFWKSSSSGIQRANAFVSGFSNCWSYSIMYNSQSKTSIILFFVTLTILKIHFKMSTSLRRISIFIAIPHFFKPLYINFL